MEHITAHNGEFTCLCGNIPDDYGFFPCDRNGNDVEPTPVGWKEELYRCDKCYRIIDQNTLEVVAIATRLSPTQSQKTGECVCDTFYGRKCCKHESHGDAWKAQCIENGQRFACELRANTKEEALELGKEIAALYGGECIDVARVT